MTIWLDVPVGLPDVHALRHHVTIDMADASGGLDSGSPAKQSSEMEINAKRLNFLRLLQSYQKESN